jgi:hypothetical protein
MTTTIVAFKGDVKILPLNKEIPDPQELKQGRKDRSLIIRRLSLKRKPLKGARKSQEALLWPHQECQGL